MKRVNSISRILFASVAVFLLMGGLCERDETIPPVACFTYTPTDGIMPDEEVTFTNCSTDAESYSWNFDDGETSVSASPMHSFDEPGEYDVKLVVKNNDLADEMVQTIVVEPNDLTGTWSKILYIDTERYDGTLELVQDANDNLTGSFVFSDGSGFTSLLSSSNVSGDNVTIEWMLDNTYKCTFPGTLNASFTYMSGNWSSLGVTMGTWSATKETKKSAIVTTANTNKSEKERFLEALGK